MPKQLFVDPKRLRPNPWNPNHVSPENQAKLGESVRTLGWFKPIVVRYLPDVDSDTDFEILGGQHRWEFAIEEGTAQVPIFDVGDISDDLAKKISLADNPRYGVDDTVELAKLLKEIGSSEDVQAFLPFTDTDISAIFASQDIALDDLDLPENFDSATETPEPSAKVAKTHTIMRFKVALADAERLTELLTKIQKRQGFTSSDELTNAGDALVFALGQSEASEA